MKPLRGTVANFLNGIKKGFIVFTVLIIILNLFSYFIVGNQSTVKINPVKENRKKIYEKIQSIEDSGTGGKQYAVLYRSITCSLIGEVCKDDLKNSDSDFNSSFFGQVSNIFIAPLANPPASGIYWTITGLEKSGFIPKSFAAEGIGLASIQPLAKVWSALRNVSLMLLVVVLTIIGFMIMFRVKLNPQTVIAVENSLPRFVVSLLLITFSFAIAGFLIDLMYIVSAIIISILGNAGGFDIKNATSSYLQAKPIDILGKLAGGQGLGESFVNTVYSLPNHLANILGPIVNIFLRSIFTAGVVIFLAPQIFQIVKSIIEHFFPELTTEGGFQPLGIGVSIALTFQYLKAISGPIALTVAIAIAVLIGTVLFNGLLALIIFLTMIFIFFRIFIIIVGAYLRIILLIIFSPIILLLNALPGQNVFTFSAWLKNLVAELITFPLLVTIFIIGAIIVDIPIRNQSLFTPPFMFGIAPDTLSFLLGMGLLFMTPDLIKTIKEVLLPKGLPFPAVGPGVFFGSGEFAYKSTFLPGPLQKFMSRFGFRRGGGGTTLPEEHK